MYIKFTKLSEKAINPEVLPNGMISIKACDISRLLDNSMKPVYMYHTDLTIELEEGYSAIVVPSDNNFVRSTELATAKIIDNSNWKLGEKFNDLTIGFKVNTDAIPTMYQVGEEVAKLYIVKNEQVNLAIDEYVAPVTDEPQTESMQTEETQA